MKSIVLVFIVVVAVYAVDSGSEQLLEQAESGILEPPVAVLVGMVGKPKEELQQQEDESDIVQSFKSAILAVLLRAKESTKEVRTKRSTDEKTERLTEIDALVEKLWADKENQANGEAKTDASIAEQKEEHSSTKQEVTTPRKNGPHPRFENRSEYTHDRRKLEKSKHERKNEKKGNRKTTPVVRDEVHSDEHAVDAEKPKNSKPVIEETEERKHYRIPNHKMKIPKHKKEESDEETDSTASVPKDSPTAELHKESAPVEPVTVESEQAINAPEESFISDSASPASRVPAADLAPIVSEDFAPLASAEPVPIASEDPAHAASVDPAPAASVDPAPVASADPAPVASADPAPVPTDDLALVGLTDFATVLPAGSATAASTDVSDDFAQDEMTVNLSEAINLDQARLKRHVATAESKINKRTEKPKQRKPTIVPDLLITSAESAVPQKEKSHIENKNKTSGEERVSPKHGSPTKKTHHNEKEGEEKKAKSQKKDEQQGQTVGRHASVKATQNGDANVRTHARVTDKQPPASSTGDKGKVGSGGEIHAKNQQTKYSTFATASPKNVKTGDKKASAASARDGVSKKGEIPVAREPQSSDSTTMPAA
ncbi:proteoglycan 4-like [Daphnia carinata]|uniref:proteoglycan 4-like n=1 Tax=Daphnia carinata TaxID=120202 RepID=UPI00258013E7|nr:proteoglycan 4-like [Daphnia carinata]